MSSGTRRGWRGALLALVPVALATASCGGSGSGNAATSSTTSSTRGSSTTAGPSPGLVSTTTSAGPTATTRAGASSATSTTPAAPASTSTAAHQPTTVQVGASQNGRTVALHVGDTVQISLTGCADCGYSWRMTGRPSPVVFSYEGEQSTTPSTTSTSAGQPPIVGQPVTWTWTFKAVSAHTTAFTAGYFPPGQGTTATQSFAVQLRVAA